MEILGIDVGGSGIKAAIVNTETGELISNKHRLKTPQPATPEAVATTIQKQIKHFKWTGIVGCGFPTPLQHGKCLTGGNLHENWKGVLVNELFKNKTGNDFYIVNDADAAGLAEINFGAGRAKKGVIIMITLGTGIGSAIFVDSKLLPNTEFGHVLNKDGIVFEKYCADSIRKNEKLSFKNWGKRLNEYFKHVNLLLSPDLFIVGGGISKKIEKFKSLIKIDTPIVAAEAENEAGIIGAALAAKFEIK
ncbi:ROK family protein [Lutibacter sp. HS1-25]|uniref:polyphosphate--glucose phosphotransferase n=1 Tax=Lutibacter sp. HS1-25 TaxID=2485000 RepID=UPI001011BE75|nr:ROK family protein [Lutibacter sp. HS1-25]RXP52314.1 ROK family protein [Lutibacter sp. HS1-25]